MKRIDASASRSACPGFPGAGASCDGAGIARAGSAPWFSPAWLLAALLVAVPGASAIAEEAGNSTGAAKPDGASRAAAPSDPEAAVVMSGSGRTYEIVRLENLPFVDDDYSRRFRFDSADNPKLRELRERFRLDEVVSGGGDEFSRQVLLMDWTHRRFRRFGSPSTDASGALEILAAIDEGHTFFCKQYVEVFVSCAAGLGWVARPLALRRHQGVAKVGGSTEHSVAEIWSNQFAKWIMVDPTGNFHLAADGVPLNAWEVREAWFRQGGEPLTFLVGSERTPWRKGDLPIVLGTFEGFGELAVHPDELDKYGFIGYIPNNDLMDRGFDYGGMFITRDELCEGTRWHERSLPANPATDPYFPIGQASLSLGGPSGDGIEVTLRTMTPNLDRFEIRIDEGGWQASRSAFVWRLHEGSNRLAARTVNRFGVTGPVSTAVLESRTKRP